MTESCDSTFYKLQASSFLLIVYIFLKCECIISLGVEQVHSVKYLGEISRPVNIFFIRCRLIRIVKILAWVFRLSAFPHNLQQVSKNVLHCAMQAEWSFFFFFFFCSARVI